MAALLAQHCQASGLLSRERNPFVHAGRRDRQKHARDGDDFFKLSSAAVLIMSSFNRILLLSLSLFYIVIYSYSP